MNPDVRRRRLAQLLAQRFDHQTDALAAAVGLSPAELTAKLPAGDANMPFPRREARALEKRLGLPKHWLEHDGHDGVLFPLPDTVLRPWVEQALAEDLGRRGDITSAAVIPPGSRAKLAVVSRQHGVLAGMDLARLSFALTDPTIRFQARARDGDNIGPGQVLATVKGDARALLTAERTALNFLTHLSGIAGMTAQAVAAVAGSGAAITCSRKTLPGLRVLQKYAVRAGGGRNHRMGLDDAILIKDNHLVYAGSLTEAVRRAQAAAGHLTAVQVEVDTLEQLDEALAAGADWVLLDNMDNNTLREAVRRCHGRARTEASGGITPARLREVADCGVNSIALGYLTHSSHAHDIGLDFIGH